MFAATVLFVAFATRAGLAAQRDVVEVLHLTGAEDRFIAGLFQLRFARVAAVAGLSRMHFASQFGKATGVRPHECLLTRRVRRAEELLRDSTMPIVEIDEATLTTVIRVAGVDKVLAVAAAIDAQTH